MRDAPTHACAGKEGREKENGLYRSVRPMGGMPSERRPWALALGIQLRMVSKLPKADTGLVLQCPRERGALALHTLAFGSL